MNSMKLLLFVVCALWQSSAAFSASPGDEAPSFELIDMRTGEEIRLEQLSGQVVYLDFWASWCGPCLKSFPFMSRLQRDYGERGLAVVAVNLDQKPEDAEEFLAGNEASFIVVENQAGNVAEAYGVIAMPSTYIIDRDGRIAEVHHGFKSEDEDEIRRSVVALL